MPKYVQPYYVTRNLKKEPNCRQLMGKIKGIMYAAWFVNVDTEDKRQLLAYMQEIERHNLFLQWAHVKEIDRFLHNMNKEYNPKINNR